MKVMQAAIVIVIVVVAAYGLYRLLRKKTPANNCRECPLAEKCAQKSHKKSKKSCI